MAYGYEWGVWMTLPTAIIERARKYRGQDNGDWGSWCDGSQTNEGHFQGLEVQSILTDGVEVRLCRDCRQVIHMDSFNEFNDIEAIEMVKDKADV